MMIDEEKFFAWLDGELSGEDAAEIKAQVAADPGLAHLAEQHRAMGMRLNKAFDTVAEAPVPSRLRSAIEPPQAKIVDLAAAREKREARRRWAAPGQWAAMAATLVLGVAL